MYDFIHYYFKSNFIKLNYQILGSYGHASLRHPSEKILEKCSRMRAFSSHTHRIRCCANPRPQSSGCSQPRAERGGGNRNGHCAHCGTPLTGNLSSRAPHWSDTFLYPVLPSFPFSFGRCQTHVVVQRLLLPIPAVSLLHL